MSTNAMVSVEVDGIIHAVYVHWDGSIDDTGKILQEHYNSQELAKSLVSYGDISVIGSSNECPEGHSFATPVDGYTVYYGRDRGEKGVERRLFKTFNEAALTFGLKHNYLFKSGKWYVSSNFNKDALIPLEEAIELISSN